MLDKLRVYIDENCIVRVPAGSRELPAIDGKGFYRWQFYLRSALLEGRFLDTIARTFWDRFSERYTRAPFQLAGVKSASLPITTAPLLKRIDAAMLHMPSVKSWVNLHDGHQAPLFRKNLNCLLLENTR